MEGERTLGKELEIKIEYKDGEFRQAERLKEYSKHGHSLSKDTVIGLSISVI